MIRSYADEGSRDVHFGENTRQARRIPSTVWAVAQRKLNRLAAATSLGDLSTPGNNLEKLRGSFAGRYSIRVNDQWRIIFRFSGSDAFDVLIDDYH